MSKLHDYVSSDYYRTFGKPCSMLKAFLIAVFRFNRSFTYLFWHRCSCYGFLMKPLAIIMRRFYQILYSIDIPRGTTLGYGLNLGHGMCIVVNMGTTIGNNVNLSQFVNIGTNVKGENAVIGDEVYVGPQSCIIGKIHIGDGAVIGAHSVVKHDVPSDTIVAGNPAKVIRTDQSRRYILRKSNKLK